MRPAIERRAARHARLHGPPYLEYENAYPAANGVGVGEGAGEHTSGAEPSTLPRYWRGHLKSPLQFYTGAVADLVAKGGAATACCPMHPDGKRSLFVDLASQHGKWSCPICGAGDMIDFVMRLHVVTFVEAVRYLMRGAR